MSKSPIKQRQPYFLANFMPCSALIVLLYRSCSSKKLKLSRTDLRIKAITFRSQFYLQTFNCSSRSFPISSNSGYSSTGALLFNPIFMVSTLMTSSMHSIDLQTRIYNLKLCLCSSSSSLLCTIHLFSPLRLKLLLFASCVWTLTQRFYLAALNFTVKFSTFASLIYFLYFFLLL